VLPASDSGAYRTNPLTRPDTPPLAHLGPCRFILLHGRCISSPGGRGRLLLHEGSRRATRSKRGAPHGIRARGRVALAPEGSFSGIIRGLGGSCLQLSNEAVKILSGCREVTMLFDAFVDDELMSAAQSRVRYHIASCGSCAAFVEEKIELKRLVKASVGNLTAPYSLRERLRARTRP
jgi:hypothetical protein